MSERNVLGEDLEPCGTDPVTGFYRDGSCMCGPEDIGVHGVWVNGTEVADGDGLVPKTPLAGELLTRFAS